MASKRIKYLDELNKRVWNFYPENYSVPSKAVTGCLDSWEHIASSWLEGLMLLNCNILQTNSDWGWIAMKLPAVFLAKIDRQGPTIVHKDSESEDQTWKIHIFRF